MRTALIGVGSLGTVLGAYISRAGFQIDLIDTNEEHVNALNKNGAHVIGAIDFITPVKALTPDKMEGVYDVVLLLVKQTFNESAFAAITQHIHENSIIVTLQNGLPERACIKEFGEARVMGCPVGWGAAFKSPGVSELTTELDRLSLDLGRLDGKITPEMHEIQKMLSAMCKTKLHTNLMGIRWTKLLTNATFSGMSTVCGVTFGEILDNPQALLCVKYIANECIKVARAAKIKMEPIQGFDLGALLGFDTLEQRDANTSVYLDMWGPHRKLTASMLQDFRRGLKKVEIRAINGVVCEMGREYGVATPINDKVVEIVTAIEDGKLICSTDNLDKIELPV
jgi:2-dehydropantoate 2-reductase